MKYVIAWEVRENASSEETQVRGYQVFGKWSPAEGSDFRSSSIGSTAAVASVR